MGNGASSSSRNGTYSPQVARNMEYGWMNQQETIGEGATFNTVAAVAAINGERFDDTMRDRTFTTRELNSIKDGQSVTIYHAMRDATGGYVPNTAESVEVWTKRGRDEWQGGANGRKEDTQYLTRRLHSPDSRYELAAGKVSTEDHLPYTSDTSRKVNGLTYRSGIYDIQANRGEGAKKYEQRGSITTYDGTLYGVTKEGNRYNVTHIPTGLSVGRAQSMGAASDMIRTQHERVSAMGDMLKRAEKKFAATIRGD